MSGAGENMVEKVLGENKMSMKEGELLGWIGMAEDICVEGD